MPIYGHIFLDNIVSLGQGVVFVDHWRLSCSFSWRLPLASHLSDPEWGCFWRRHKSTCRLCPLRQPRWEEVCSLASRFQVRYALHRQICIRFRLERIALFKSVRPWYRQFRQIDGIRRGRNEHLVRSLATFYEHLGLVPHLFYIGCDGPVVCLCKNVSPGHLTSLFAELWEALEQKINLPLICWF